MFRLLSSFDFQFILGAQARGDKILIFFDDVFALKAYAARFEIPFIYGGTKESERQRVYSAFRHSNLLNTIAVSKVGDVAIDLPEATVIIQVSSHFGSRRQEAQRLGRILRPKPAQRRSEFNAFFYSLVSCDTQEVYHSARRQQYLVDQGYSYGVTKDLASDDASSCLGTREAELALLQDVLCAGGGDSSGGDHQSSKECSSSSSTTSKQRMRQAHVDEDDEDGGFILGDEDDEDDPNSDGRFGIMSGDGPIFTRSARSIAALTGCDDDVYVEYES